MDEPTVNYECKKCKQKVEMPLNNCKAFFATDEGGSIRLGDFYDIPILVCGKCSSIICPEIKK